MAPAFAGFRLAGAKFGAYWRVCPALLSTRDRRTQPPPAMKIDPRDFRVAARSRVRLREWPTHVKPLYKSRKHYEKDIGENIEKLRSLQDRLYANNRYSILLIFQAMDAAGKDG